VPSDDFTSENPGVQMTLEGGKLEADWNFAKADTGYLTHGLHVYPARMVPQIARRLIHYYTKEYDSILDPFCGSGTTLVEARLTKRNAVGIDTNPLAVLLAKVKSTPIDFTRANFSMPEFLVKLEKKFSQARRGGKLPEPPLHINHNLLHWFKEDIARELEFLYQNIMRIEDRDVRDFMKVVLSDTIFRCSNIDHRSSRFIRILPKHKLERFRPNVLEQFRKKLINSVNKMSVFYKETTETASESSNPLRIEAKMGDARKLRFRKETFHAIITSPPYGEEKNTVGYARWSKLSVAWLRLNHEKLRASERRSLGFFPLRDAEEELRELPSPTAKALLSQLVQTDKQRVSDALPFFYDYLVTLKQMHRVLKPTGYCCIVIGDRSIKQRPLDMEKVTIELGAEAGFMHIKSYFREIPMKLIPWTTPTGKTISRESIIILQKGGSS
jgi:site-specific DNA-methyltransferase (cytosine-N4-specific)